MPTITQAQAPGTIVTIAGGGSQEGENIPATNVGLILPLGISLDIQGNIYIADSQNHRIRRVDITTGNITTVAGTGTAGFAGDGGPATQAQLNRPSAVAVDNDGTIYIGDTENRRIRRVTPTGVITTIAGTGARGFSGNGGPAIDATFGEITALLVGGGRLFISDGIDANGQGNNRVRQMVLSTGEIFALAGNGSANETGVASGGSPVLAGLTPEQLAFGPDFSIYIADFNNGKIRRVFATSDSTSGIATVAGRNPTQAEQLASDIGQLDALFKGDGGLANQALFFAPAGVVLDVDGNIYIADTGNHRIRVVDAVSGNVFTLAGTGAIGTGPENELGLRSDLASPSRVLVDANGDLIFVDTGNHRIRKLFNARYRTPLFVTNTTNINFERVSFGDPVTRTLEVQNRGNLPVNIQSSTSNNTAFRVVTPLPFQIGVSQIAQIEVQFDPLGEGIADGIITITTDDPRTPAATFNVTGQGEAPQITLFPNDRITFDRTFIGQTSTASVRVANIGAGTLVIRQATSTDSQFVAQLTDPLRVTSGGFQNLNITFRPTVEDTQNAVLTLFTNAPSTPTITINLQGIGQRAQPGGFINVASDLALGDTGAGFGASWADVNNDNKPDLYLVRSFQPNRYYRNDGNTFTEMATSLGIDDSGDGHGAAWADTDKDGDLDLYVANFVTNHYYRNDGNTFTEYTDSLGLTDTESSIQPAWADYDNDGDPDLFLANSGPDKLFRNDNGKFTLISNQLTPADNGPSFGAAWGDYENDGDLDLFVTYFNAPNRFYINNNNVFQENARNTSLLDEGRGRGVVWGDFNNDGYLDLYVTNSGQPNLYYRNIDQSGFRIFTEEADTLGLASNVDSRGLAVADYDGDGGLDIYVAVQNGADLLFKNREANGNWLNIQPIATETGIDAIGLRLEFSYNNGQQAIREISGGSSYLSQNARNILIGVNTAEQIDILTLRWPSGIVQQFIGTEDNLRVNQTLSITEQQPLPPAKILLEANPTNLLANGVSEAILTATVLNAENKRVLISNRAIQFRIITGDGIFVGGDSTAIKDGIATARYRAGQTPGRVTISAQSPNLIASQVNIELIKPIGEDALTMRTIAGSGFLGGFSGDGGLATEAALQLPSDVLADEQGNIYIADTNNNRIRKIDATTGNILTIIGSAIGSSGGDGGPASDATVATPQGITFTPTNNLIISEAGGQVIRRVQNDTITTIVGTGVAQFGGDNGPAINANISRPLGVATDRQGNIYIADSFNRRVRKIDTNGIITTFAGTGSPDTDGFSGDGGPASLARLSRISSVAVDSLGRVFIADTQNNRVRMVDTNGIITTIAGTGIGRFGGDGGSGTLADLDSPQGLAVDQNNLYIADTGNQRIRLLNLSTGLIQTVAGTGQGTLDLEEGGALAVSLNNPTGLAIGPTGTVLIADRSNHRIRELSIQFDLPNIFNPTEKTADFNADNKLDFADFLLFVNAFGKTDARFDLNSDGLINLSDFILFARAFETNQAIVRP
ncbi:MAG: FG-GAP-like repeat-containing protein [Candidatus Latescibacterota bacterium]